MPLRIWCPRPLDQDLELPLRAALASDVELVTGPAAPAGYEVLVEGVPSREQLAGSAALRALVIPYAGMPVQTRELLADFSALRVHNLHHNAAPTAETAVALLLAAAKCLVPADRGLRAGDWTIRYAPRAGRLLEGRRALILGYGHIGRRVGRALAALGLGVRGLRRRPDPAASDELGPDQLDAALAEADTLVLCLPATPATSGLLGARELALLPPAALVVNVGRADTIDERALYDALRSGRIGAAGLDVWYRYPRAEEERTCTPPAELPFGELENVVLSPHRAGHCDRTAALRADHLARLLNALAEGREPDRVDVERGY